MRSCGASFACGSRISLGARFSLVAGVAFRALDTLFTFGASGARFSCGSRVAFFAFLAFGALGADGAGSAVLPRRAACGSGEYLPRRSTCRQFPTTGTAALRRLVYGRYKGVLIRGGQLVHIADFRKELLVLCQGYIWQFALRSPEGQHVKLHRASRYAAVALYAGELQLPAPRSEVYALRCGNFAVRQLCGYGFISTDKIGSDSTACPVRIKRKFSGHIVYTVRHHNGRAQHEPLPAYNACKHGIPPTVCILLRMCRIPYSPLPGRPPSARV